MSNYKLKFYDRDSNEAMTNDYDGALSEAVQIIITRIKNEARIMKADLVSLYDDIVIGKFEYNDEEIELTELMGTKIISKNIVGEELILNAFETIKEDVNLMQEEEKKE